MIAVGQYSTSLAAVSLAEKYPDDVWASIGFTLIMRPLVGIMIEEQKSNQPEILIGKVEELAKNSRVVAIGECGLDYFRLRNTQHGAWIKGFG